MEIRQNYSLKKYNTFGFDVLADYFAQPVSIDEIKEILSVIRAKQLPLLIVGKGSNLLFCDNFHGIVIAPQIMGIDKISEDSDSVFLKVGAGVVWDDFVQHAVNNGWGGIENLSLIPGCVGASPIQNIGAYGVEAKDTIFEVEYIEIATGEKKTISNVDCKFGYRDSVFKHELQNKVIVTHVVFRLNKKPVLYTHYGNIEEELATYSSKTIATVRDVIIAIRQKKLPDPSEIGNAGSFFKNPMVSKQQAEAILAVDEKMQIYPVDEKSVKLPAARLIELAGWKGKRVGNVGVHEQQALVLVNYGQGTGKEILDLARAIQQSVHEKFGVMLELEVNIVK